MKTLLKEKLGKFASVFLEILKNRKKIQQGFINLLLRKQEIEAIAAYRMSKCETCVFMDRKGSDCAVPGTQPCCSICGCCLSLLTRSLSTECSNDDNKLWHAVITQEQEDKLYEKINYKAE
jgi:hypothetical protein